MRKIAICLFLYCNFLGVSYGQTTDLAIAVVAEDSSGNAISDVDIYQEFLYVVTIINSGDVVNGVSFLQTLNADILYLGAIGQNATGGSSDVSNLNFTANMLTGFIENMPSNSSVEVKVMVKAPLNPGGIATNAMVSPPGNVTDTNTSNNESIISIDVNDLPIGFTVTHIQVSPSGGNPITDWNDTVVYDVTIMNNSTIDYPLERFKGKFQLESNIIYGTPVVVLESISCIGGTNGMSCPTIPVIPSTPTLVTSTQTAFVYDESIIFNANSNLTFQLTYRFMEPTCALELSSLEVNAFFEIEVNHINESSNDSNVILTPLIESELCPQTDLCIETVQIDPDQIEQVDWNEEVTFVTTVCNNGPLDVVMRFFLQNLSVSIEWDIISITCDGTTGDITCNDFVITDEDLFWGSDNFILPSDTTIEITTIAVFLETDDCEIGAAGNSMAHIRSGTNLLSLGIVDGDLSNNAESDFVILPPLPECDPDEIADLHISKNQITPVPPEGSDQFNTTSWGEITYEIVITNPDPVDTFIAVRDFMPQGANNSVSATLVSVDCVSTTGTAACQDVDVANIGVVLDGIPEMGELDVFWEVLPSDNWNLPAQSSLTFHVVIDWQPECSDEVIAATNKVMVESVGDVVDTNELNNEAQETTYFAPCVDLLVQTYPESTLVMANQNFNWIIDITNSNTSSNAVNIDFEDVIGSEFTLANPITCTVTSGNATCISNFNVNGNTVFGNIPSMDAASTVQIRIPVVAPSYGGAFTNTAMAIPSEIDNEELTPETNVSISNVQVITPTVVKTFVPDEIVVGEQSILEFTVNNLVGNPQQSNISFIDNLPTGLTLAGAITWIQDNGCTAVFSGSLGNVTVNVSNLTFPEGVASCTFAVPVTSTVIGSYVNNSMNFTDVDNLDASQTSAILNVFEDTSDVDIEVLKSVIPSEASIGDEVIFEITAMNIGTTTATDVSLFESLPMGYHYVSSAVSVGVYESSSYFWNIGTLNAGQIETLYVTARVISSNNLLNTASLSDVEEVDRDESNNEGSAEVLVNDCLEVPEGFSPNADGYNDVLTIPCIEEYSENNIKIYNRYGKLVFETSNYENNWNGIPNQGAPKISETLPTGTYYYVIAIAKMPEPMVGWIYLNR